MMLHNSILDIGINQHDRTYIPNKKNLIYLTSFIIIEKK